MNKTKRIISIFIIVYVLSYIVTAYTVLDFNFINWSKSQRYAQWFFGSIIGLLSALISNENE